MAKYKATFWRGNPQLRNGGSERTRIYEAASKREAERMAHKTERGCAYGTMTLLDLERMA